MNDYVKPVLMRNSKISWTIVPKQIKVKKTFVDFFIYNFGCVGLKENTQMTVCNKYLGFPQKHDFLENFELVEVKVRC